MADHSGLEAAIVLAISAARADPAKTRATIEQRLPHFKGKDFFPPERGGKVAVASKEGKEALEDAVAFLTCQTPLGPLVEPSCRGLKLAAEDHLVDRGALGKVGHSGADGSSSSERQARYGEWSGKSGECLWFGRPGASAETMVTDLIIDDGVPSRGHRLCIFDPAYGVASVRVGDHATFGWMAVIEFAGGYTSDEAKVARREEAGAPKPEPESDDGSGVVTQWNLGKCARCQEAIHGGSVMEIPRLGKLHKACFTCVHCSAHLAGVPWKLHSTEGTHCEACYAARFAPNCQGCGLKISGGGVRVNGDVYHKGCRFRV